MDTKKAMPTTLIEAITYYADNANCERTMIATMFPNGLCCPRCGDVNVTKLSRPGVWKCNGCKKQFTLKVGTIFEDSPLSLSKWLPAVWLLSGAKNGISSCELARAIGVTQKTAWFMLHRIRHAMQSGTFHKTPGPVEADETFVGGLEKNKHKDKKLNAGRGGVGKTIVMGVLERGSETFHSRVRASVIENTDKLTLHAEINSVVSEFATVYTDAWRGYNGLSEKFIHEFVDHTVHYAIGQVHTNGIENFWALLKRCLRGTYISVEPFHLKAYIDEMVFRFNHRAGDDLSRFLTALAMTNGKRLTYDALTSAYEEYYQQAQF